MAIRCLARSAWPTLARARPRSFSVSVTFVDEIEGEIPLKGEPGVSLLELAHKANVDLEGACGGELACSTCHCIFSQEDYDRIIEACPKTEEEEDMLDLAWGLTETSRLGCQVLLSDELEGIKAHIPDETSNMQ